LRGTAHTRGDQRKNKRQATQTRTRTHTDISVCRPDADAPPSSGHSACAVRCRPLANSDSKRRAWRRSARSKPRRVPSPNAASGGAAAVGASGRPAPRSARSRLLPPPRYPIDESPRHRIMRTEDRGYMHVPPPDSRVRPSPYSKPAAPAACASAHTHSSLALHSPITCCPPAAMLLRSAGVATCIMVVGSHRHLPTIKCGLMLIEHCLLLRALRSNCHTFSLLF
jgi:hypothetical protein